MQKLLNAYGLFLVAYFVLRLLTGDNLSWVALCSNCIPTALFPAFFAIVVALKKRDRVMILWGSFAIAYLVFEFGPRFLPKIKGKQIDQAGALVILSHNTGQDLPEYAIRDRLIRNSNADIVILQEITQVYIEQHWPVLLDLYPYQISGPLQDDNGNQVGMGILSRYPIVEAADFKLAEKGLVYQQRAVIDANGKNIVVYNIHTTFPWIFWGKDPIFSRFPWPVYDDRVRREEIEKLVELLEQEEHPVIVAGDFNLNDQSSDYQKLRNSNLVDAYRNAGMGFGFTWPANRTPSVNIRPSIPSVRVDYLFHSHDFQSGDAQVLGETGSDHKPILVSLTLKD